MSRCPTCNGKGHIITNVLAGSTKPCPDCPEVATAAPTAIPTTDQGYSAYNAGYNDGYQAAIRDMTSQPGALVTQPGAQTTATSIKGLVHAQNYGQVRKWGA